MIYALGLFLLLLLSILSYLLYSSKEDFTLKLISFPVLIMVSLLLGAHYLESFGRPVAAEPKGEWNYVFHQTNGTDIELWVVDKKGSKLYIFPYDAETQKQLEQAGELASEGNQVQGEFNNDSETEERLNIRIDTRTIPKDV